MTDEGPGRPAGDASEGRRPSWARALFRLSPWGLRRHLDALATDLAGHVTRLERRIDGVDLRLDAVDERLALEDRRRQGADARLDAAEAALRAVQENLASLRDERTARLEERLDLAERLAGAASDEAARLRDRVVPAVVERGNVLVDRLAEEIEEVASLVERVMLGEPLPAPAGGDRESRIADALAEVQPRLLEALRGSEEEIRHRLEHHLATLRKAAPVLDLGCGRGELLLLLREAGVEASGVEVDPALARAARRRGLDVVEGGALEVLRSHSDERWGAVTAVHLLEHLETGALLRLLSEVRRVLRPGGLLLVECPNPHNLRVGASLFWLDPTHSRPLLPESLELYLATSGFEVRSRENLHPFPDEQGLSGASAPVTWPDELAPLADRLDRLTRRLDELLYGPRDFAIVAARPPR